MRKWFIFVMTAVGMTLLMLLGASDWIAVEDRPQGIEDSVALKRMTSEASDTSIDLVAVVAADAFLFAKLQAATERFKQARPNVSVTLRNVTPEQLAATYVADMKKGEGPDILLYPTSWIRYEAAEGRLLALDNYIPPEWQSQWFESVRGAVRWNGYVWGVPLYWDPYVFVTAEPPVAEEEALLAVTQWLAVSSDVGSPGLNRYSDDLLADWGAADSGTVVSGGTVEQVLQGQSPWALVPLSEILFDSARNLFPSVAASAFVPDPEQPEGTLPPFTGMSFVLSPSAAHPAEAAEWIRSVTELNKIEELSILEKGYFPVYRSLYGLATVLGEGLNQSEPPPFVSLPEPDGRQGRELWRLLKPVMQMIERVPAANGAIPSELPRWPTP